MELEIRDIKKKYGKKMVLRQINLTALSGQCTGIVGANGCGKSTLLRILAGVEKADAGEILINGKEIKNPLRQMAAYVGYIPQESALMPELTVRDNLKLWASFGDYRENCRNLKKLCEQFQIQTFYKEKVKNLSGGMCKRVNIVCALIHSPSLLLMDEPSAALDMVFKEELKGYIRNFVKEGGSILLSSHDEGEITACQSLWAIKDGMAVRLPKEVPVEEMVSKYMK
ncbi:MAG: ATP-binding cassette domain-containing protein [Lachnospiraceae bacterium]|nr:ATP-binding cassette domain-containing protein [Lachnospiraceae bacterium]